VQLTSENLQVPKMKLSAVFVSVVSLVLLIAVVRTGSILANS
jgi:hypothetical protein